MSSKSSQPKPSSKANGKNKNKQNQGQLGSMESSAPASLAVLKGFSGPGKKRSSWRFNARERIAAISGTSSATVPTVTTFSLNPGLSASFPWLSTEADAWDQYTFIRLIPEWIPATGSSGAGFAALSPEYDPSDPAPTTIAQITNTENAVVQRVWEHFVCPLDYKAMHAIGPRKFVRTGNVAGGLQTFDVGKLNVATWGQGNTNAAGEVWMNYEVEFNVPQNSPSASAPGSSTASIFVNSAGAQTFTTNVAAALLAASVTDPLGIGAQAVGLFTPPSGAYLIKAQTTMSNSAAEDGSFTIEIFKNGAALSTPFKSAQAGSDALPLASKISGGVQGIVSCSGTDTVSISVTMTGASGTLTAAQNFSSILFQSV